MTTTTDDASPAQASALPGRQPGTHRPAIPRSAQPPGYDLDRTWDLLAETCELPATERGLLKVLAEYRKALHALATHLQAVQRGQRLTEPPRDAGTASHGHG
jgi:hypothetical protein